MENPIELLELASKSVNDTAEILAKVERLGFDRTGCQKLQELCARNQRLRQEIINKRTVILHNLVSAAFCLPNKEYHYSRDIFAGLCNYVIVGPNSISVETSPREQTRMADLTGKYTCGEFASKSMTHSLWWANFCNAMIRRLKDSLEHDPGRLNCIIEATLEVVANLSELATEPVM